MLMFIYNCINCIVKTKEHRTKNSCKRQKYKEKDKENLKKKNKRKYAFVFVETMPRCC